MSIFGESYAYVEDLITGDLRATSRQRLDSLILRSCNVLVQRIKSPSY